MKLIYRTSTATHEQIERLNERVRSGEITPQERNEIILACFKSETERLIHEQH